MLDPRRHPFWEFSERILFLARRGSETVARIAGIIDRHYNQAHDEKMGIWPHVQKVNNYRKKYRQDRSSSKNLYSIE